MVHSIRVMIEEVSKGHQHGLGQSPAKTSSHHNSIAEIEQLPGQLLLEEMGVGSDDFLEGDVGRGKFCPDFIHKIDAYKGILDRLNLLVFPVNERFSDVDALQVGKVEGILAFHLLENEKESEDVEVLIVIVLALKQPVLREEETDFRVHHPRDADD